MVDENGIWDISEAVWIERFLLRGFLLTNQAGIVPEHEEIFESYFADAE